MKVKWTVSLMAALTLMATGGTMMGATIVGQWNLNEGSGTTLSPVVGSISGTINSISAVSWVNSGPPTTYLSPSVSPTNSLSFNGTSLNPASFPNTGNVLTPGQVSVALWVKTTADNTGRIMLSTEQGPSPFNASWEFAVGENGNLFFRTFVGQASVFAGSTASNPFTAAELADGNWHFLVGTHDATSTTLYVDGQSVETVAQVGSLDVGGKMELGARPYDTVENPYYGQIGGALVVWNGALTSGEVSALYSPVPEPSTVALIVAGGMAVVLLRRRKKV